MEFWDYAVGNYYGYDRTLRERAERGEPVIVQALARMGLRIAAALDRSATLFLRAADERTLLNRLQRRGYDAEELALRREHWREEREHSGMFDIQINEAELVDTDAIIAVMREVMENLR
jgi:guanylate kinase